MHTSKNSTATIKNNINEITGQLHKFVYSNTVVQSILHTPVRRSTHAFG